MPKELLDPFLWRDGGVWDGGVQDEGAVLLEVFTLSAAFRSLSVPFGQSIVQRSFFGLLVLSFGIGTYRSFY